MSIKFKKGKIFGQTKGVGAFGDAPLFLWHEGNAPSTLIKEEKHCNSLSACVCVWEVLGLRNHPVLSLPLSFLLPKLAM